MLFLLFAIRTNINTCQPITSGKVVELNNNSIIVNRHFTNILIAVNDISQYALEDEVLIYDSKPLEFSPHLYGFNLENYSKARNICYTANEQDTYKQKGNGILHWISSGGFNSTPSFIKLSRSLLFQSNPNQTLDLFISMGIIYTLIIKLIQLCSRSQKIHQYESLFVSVIFLALCFKLAWPISLIRVWIFYLSSKYTKDRILRFSLNLILCAFINPFGLTQLAYCLPLAFQFTAIFLPLKSKFIQRCLVLILILISYQHSISLLNVLVYPLFYIIYRFLIILSLIFTLFPFFTSIYVNLVEYIDSIYRFTLNFGVIKGQINNILLILCLLIYHISIKHQKSQLIIMPLFILFGIKLISMPLFYTITMINVGQGDAILIQAPLNQSIILIDTGPPNQYRALKTFLDAQAIDKIDYLVITHDDLDHSGNLASITRDYRINEVVLKGRNIEDDWIFLDYLEFNQSQSNANDASLVYYINMMHTRFLFLGDLSTIGEAQLIAKYPQLEVDILKLGHHGSKTSTSDDLLKQIQARIGLISVGQNNYGHPSYEVIQRLNEYYITSFNSKMDGDIRIILTPFIRLIQNSKHEFNVY